MTRKSTIHLLITLIALVIYVPFLGAFHLFDWDEINFAEAAREMVATNDWSRVQIGFEAFWEKPPLFIWLQAICMKIFGINEFAARLPNALCGIVTLNILYHYGRRIIGHFAGIFWTLAFAGSLAPSLYFHSGIIDPVFNLFLFLAIHQLFLSESGKMNNETPRIHYLLAGVFSGLAVLTKGPVALLIIFLIGSVRLFMNRKFAWPGFLNLFLFFIASMGIASIWVVPEWIMHGPVILQEFVRYQMVLFKGQIEWHNQPWFYHFVVLLLLCFPASVFALPHLLRNTSFSGTEKLYASYMRATFWVVLILFSIVTTKIIHYSSLCWIPLGWFAGYTMYRRHTNRGKIPGWLFIPVILIVLLLGTVVTLIPLIHAVPQLQSLTAGIRDKTAQSILAQNGGWLGYEWVLGVAFMVCCFWWMIKYRRTPKLNANWLFIITLGFSSLLWIIVLPKTENILQGKYIQSIQSHKNNNIYMESWALKTYAIYFYGEVKPAAFKGPWEKTLANYSQYPAPLNQARLVFLLDQVVDKPVNIYTRFNFEPDYYFLEKFEKKEILGGYILWTRKDITKPDIRFNP